MAAEVSLQPEKNPVNEGWRKESGTLGTELLHTGTYLEAAARETVAAVCPAVTKQ